MLLHVPSADRYLSNLLHSGSGAGGGQKGCIRRRNSLRRSSDDAKVPTAELVLHMYVKNKLIMCLFKC